MGTRIALTPPKLIRPTTIGHLERMSGLPTGDHEARCAFWRPYAHLGAQAMLQAGVAELRWRIIEQDCGAKAKAIGLTTQEYVVLASFVESHGRTWKAQFRTMVSDGTISPTLRTLLTRRGTGWLSRIVLAKDKDGHRLSEGTDHA